jgi:hypothetical protein
MKFTWWSWRTLSSSKTRIILSTFSIWRAAQLIGQSLALQKRAQLSKTLTSWFAQRKFKISHSWEIFWRGDCLPLWEKMLNSFARMDLWTTRFFWELRLNLWQILKKSKVRKFWNFAWQTQVLARKKPAKLSMLVKCLRRITNSSSSRKCSTFQSSTTCKSGISQRSQKDLPRRCWWTKTEISYRRLIQTGMLPDSSNS